MDGVAAFAAAPVVSAAAPDSAAWGDGSGVVSGATLLPPEQAKAAISDNIHSVESSLFMNVLLGRCVQTL